MSRLIIFVVVVAAIYVLLRSYRKRAIGRDAVSEALQANSVENMVRCIYCGVHLPKSESILAENRHYCCEAHRKAHQAPPPNGDAG